MGSIRSVKPGASDGGGNDKMQLLGREGRACQLGRCDSRRKVIPYLESEPVSFYGDDLQDGQLHHRDSGLALDKAALLYVPVCPFQEQTRHIAACKDRKCNIWVN